MEHHTPTLVLVCVLVRSTAMSVLLPRICTIGETMYYKMCSLEQEMTTSHARVGIFFTFIMVRTRSIVVVLHNMNYSLPPHSLVSLRVAICII